MAEEEEEEEGGLRMDIQYACEFTDTFVSIGYMYVYVYLMYGKAQLAML